MKYKEFLFQHFFLLTGILLLIFFSSCDYRPKSRTYTDTDPVKNIAENEYIIGNAPIVSERIKTPDGYQRKKADRHSFASYLRSLPLKPHQTAVKLFNGSLKKNQSAHIAVLDIPVGTADLQQCADAVMRLRADYLLSEKRYDEIGFNFTNGFKADYSSWRKGQNIVVQGNNCQWRKSASANDTRESYELYMQKVFSYAGSMSLSAQLHPVADIRNIETGDVWIRGGSPGHAVIVIDVAERPSGEKIFLLAQSYMPAQDIHILNNLSNPKLSPWYAVDEINETLQTPEYTFSRHELKSW